MKNLIKEFKEMRAEPMFEIEHEGEYHIFYINCTDKGLEAGGCANIGFLHQDAEALTVEWDECFSLDGHLEALLERCHEYLLTNA